MESFVSLFSLQDQPKLPSIVEEGASSLEGELESAEFEEELVALVNYQKENFQVLMRMIDLVESCQKHSQWMSHWTKGSSSAEPQVGRICNSPLEDAKYGTRTENYGSSNFEIMKSRLSERLMVGVSHEKASLEHGQQLNSNMWAVEKDACREAAQKKFHRGDRSVQNPMMHKDVKLYAKTVVSKSLSVQKLSELSLDFRKLASSDNLSSEWNHFPMFAINRKIDTILNPKGRSAKNVVPSNVFVPQQTVKLNMTASNVLAFLSQEYELHSHRVTDEIMDQCKHAGGKHDGLTSNPSEQKLKGHLSLEMSCSCSKDGINSSSHSLLDKQHPSHYRAEDSDKEPTCRSSGKMLKSSVNNNKNHKIGSSSQSQKSIAPGLHKQEGFAGVMFCASVLGKEFEMEQMNCSKNNSKQDDILSDEQLHLNTHRIVSAQNVIDSYMLPNPTAHTVTVNNKAEVATKPSDIVADSTKQKGPYLFEMLTMPSNPQNTNPGYSLPSGNSTAFGVNLYGTNAGSHLFGANKSSAKTDTLYIDTQHISKSSAGKSAYGCARKAKSEQMATLRKREPNQLTDGSNAYRLITRILMFLVTRGQRIDEDDMTDRVREKQALDEGMELQGVRETSPVPAKSTNRWIGRWCQGGVHPVLHENDPDQKKKATKPDLASAGLEGQFLSITAMAMMGASNEQGSALCAGEEGVLNGVEDMRGILTTNIFFFLISFV
ncbi:hypothetical protein ABZP36_012930 [Zizania latifolia]